VKKDRDEKCDVQQKVNKVGVGGGGSKGEVARVALSLAESVQRNNQTYQTADHGA
jgi:hypothetical protein